MTDKGIHCDRLCNTAFVTIFQNWKYSRARGLKGSKYRMRESDLRVKTNNP
jgi:hypothetical protein